MSETDKNAVSGGEEEMSVTTGPFALTPKVYFRVLLYTGFMKYWWVIALVSIFVGMAMGLSSRVAPFWYVLNLTVVPILVSGFYVLFLYFYFRRMAYHKANKPVMKTRVLTFRKDKIIVKIVPDDPVEEENVNFAKREDFFGVLTVKTMYLFYLTPYQFLYVDKGEFQNVVDYELFKREIVPIYSQNKIFSFWRGFFVMLAGLVFCWLIVFIILLLLH